MLAGGLAEGGRLTVSHGTWATAGALAYAYTWYRCDTMGAHCAVLRGVSAKSHRLGANDVGHTFSVAVRAFDAKGSASTLAGLIGPVAGRAPRLAALARPAVSGAAVEGGTVQVRTGRWRPAPAGFDYQWTRCSPGVRHCVPIGGANGASHEVVAADVGHVLAAIVQAHAGGGARAVFSTATAVVAAAGAPRPSSGPSLLAPPAVAEVLQQGGVLTGVAGSWSGSGALSFAYQWYRCDGAGAHCKSIHGATGLTYTEVAKDVGSTLGFAVRATDRTGTTSVYASLVGPVAAPAGLAATAQPGVAGTASPGQAVQVSSGSWSRPPGGFAYQWLRCNANGRLCAPIEGATAASYTVAAADAGHALVASVSATADGTTQATLSTRSAVVA
jgi:hypothetical protein